MDACGEFARCAKWQDAQLSGEIAVKSRGWATVARMARSEDTIYLLKPRGLSLGHTYRITYDSRGESVTMRGLELARDGLPIRLEASLDSELILFVEENKRQ